MKKYYIYKIECSVSGIVYIGCTFNYAIRFRAHLYNLEIGLHVNRGLQRDYDKYGKECFNVSIIDERADKYWRLTENEYILQYIDLTGVYNVNMPAINQPPKRYNLKVDLCKKLWNRLRRDLKGISNKTISEQSGCYYEGVMTMLNYGYGSIQTYHLINEYRLSLRPSPKAM